MILRTAVAIASLYAVMASPDQVVLAPSNADDFVRHEGNLPTLADLLTLETRASIFYSYAREVDISARFTDSVAQGQGVTVFVPTNKAIQALARKPHEDPRTDRVGLSDAEHDSISRSNVYRWVGAHIVSRTDINFTSSETYETLTPGTTISFHPVNTQDNSRPAPEPHTTSDTTHFSSVKGPSPNVDTDAAHFASIKGPVGQPGQAQEESSPVVDTDAAHFSTIKGPQGAGGSHMKLRFGHAAAGRVDTDAAHFASIKGTVSPDRAPQTVSADQTPVWEKYELNDGAHIIAEKQASNGIFYLIDGTVLV